MFKRLKKDRNNILLIFFLESIIAIGLIVALIVLNNNAFVKQYGIYIIIAYFLLAFGINVFSIIQLLSRTEKYLDRTDITIASIFGNEVAPVFEFGNIAIFVYNEFDEVIWISQTTLIKKDEVLGQKVYDLIPDFDDLVIEENLHEIYANIGGKTFQIEINTGLKVIYLKDTSAQVIQTAKVESERPLLDI